MNHMKNLRSVGSGTGDDFANFTDALMKEIQK